PAALPPRRPALRLRAVGHAIRAGDAERVPARRRRDPLGRDAGGRGALRRGRRPPRQLRDGEAAMKTLRTETEAGVRSIVLARPAEYNTITPALREELAAAIEEADADPAVRVILLRAEGPAFCAGYGLDWSTEAQAEEGKRGRVGASVADPRR